MSGEPLPPLAGVDPSLAGVVLRACAHDRGARFASATELREALEALAGGGGHAPKAGPAPAGAPNVAAAFAATGSAPAAAYAARDAGEGTARTEGTAGVFMSGFAEEPPGEADGAEGTEGVFAAGPDGVSETEYGYFKEGEIMPGVKNAKRVFREWGLIAFICFSILVIYVAFVLTADNDNSMKEEPIAELKEESFSNLGLRELPISEIPGDTERLFLDGNQIIDISALSGLTDLTRLYLWGNPLTERQVNELRNALPKCKIIF
jgi:hypothetical protein